MDIADRIYGRLGRGVHQDTQAIADGIAAERERCREVARKVIFEARMGDIDSDLRSIGHILDDRLSEPARGQP
ncbi:hypothetical protein [Aquamicrobium defluvii]|nr:hypothetical protein [Aquamicrobium defluvii]